MSNNATCVYHHFNLVHFCSYFMFDYNVKLPNVMGIYWKSQALDK